MTKMKTQFNLDRKQLTSEHINSRQDFDKVLKGSQAANAPFWKSPWFYGPTGLATIAVIVAISFMLGENTKPTVQNNIKPSQVSLASLEDTPCIKPISETSDLAFNVYSIDPKRGGNIILPTGTEIKINKNSLLTSESGTVEIRVREFHDKAEAFIAGIPMDYGKTKAFESAGMIEIRAMQGNEEVSINEKYPIEISMSLHKNPEDGFKFWYLDEDKSEWQEHDAYYENRSSEDNRQEIASVEKSLTKVQNLVDNCQKEIAKVEATASDNSLLPTLGARKLQIAFDEKDFPELKGYKDIEFEYVNYNEEVAKVLKSQVWNEVNLSKAGDYIAIFKNSKGTQSVKVKPVLKGKTLQEVEAQIKAAEAIKTKELARLQKEKEELKARALELEAKYQGLIADMQTEIDNSTKRTALAAARARQNTTAVSVAAAEFRTTRFGIYNCDKPIPYPAKRPEFVAFTDQQENQLVPKAIYVFDLQKDTRYTYLEVGNHPLESVGWFNNPTTVIIMDNEGRMFYSNNIQEQQGMRIIALEKLEKNDLTADNLKKIIRESTAVI